MQVFFAPTQNFWFFGRIFNTAHLGANFYAERDTPTRITPYPSDNDSAILSVSATHALFVVPDADNRI